MAKPKNGKKAPRNDAPRTADKLRWQGHGNDAAAGAERADAERVEAGAAAARDPQFPLNNEKAAKKAAQKAPAAKKRV
ncbi:hypothetical protein [Actinomadura sp. 9N407]|uniref:hypothetical protein n=1 Tax=Actinomadura sp. 9N407 TaxID=3375154 RepID=UPI0037AB4197